MLSFFRDVVRMSKDLGVFASHVILSTSLVFGFTVLGAWLWTQPWSERVMVLSACERYSNHVLWDTCRP